jgi:hypothetical protein
MAWLSRSACFVEGAPRRERSAGSVYRDALGLLPDAHADYEQRAGDTCFGIWEPEKMGISFVAQKGNPSALGCDDVAATRAELEAKGVEFAGDALDTGVCHMAFFSDPDGNGLMLHHRYAAYGLPSWPTRRSVICGSGLPSSSSPVTRPPRGQPVGMAR